MLKYEYDVIQEEIQHRKNLEEVTENNRQQRVLLKAQRTLASRILLNVG